MADDLIRKSDVLETYADLYDIFDDNKTIQEELHKVFDKINNIPSVESNCSEKPNNCEHITEDGVTCAKYPACDDCLDNPLNKAKGSERLVKGSEQTKPTISKMEQVDKDINVRSKDKPQTDEPTWEQVKEYCNKRCLDIVDSALRGKWYKEEPHIVGKHADVIIIDEPQKLDCRNKKYYSSCEYANKCHPTVCFKALDEFKEKLKDEPQISPSDCKTCKNNLWSTPRTCGKCSRQEDGKPSMYEPQTERNK